MRVALCDDEQGTLNELASQIEDALAHVGLNVSVKTFESVKPLQNNNEIMLFDVFFLDIDMPGIDGIVFGAYLRERNSDACIVFLSNREDRVFDTFRTAPLRFIRKNKFQEEIGDTAQAILSWWEKRGERFLSVMVSGQYTSFPLDDIYYIECFGRKQDIVTTSQTKTIAGTLSELEGKLLNCGFIKPHRGYLVNYKHITSFKASSIHMRNGVAIPVSRYKMPEVKQTFMRLIARESSIIKYQQS